MQYSCILPEGYKLVPLLVTFQLVHTNRNRLNLQILNVKVFLSIPTVKLRHA